MGCSDCPETKSPADKRPGLVADSLPPNQVGNHQAANVVYGGGPPLTPFLMMRSLIPQGDGMPVVRDDGSLEYPSTRPDVPPPLEGYERDPNNPRRLVPLWEPCQLRMYGISIGDCNCVQVSAACNHPWSEHFAQSVTYQGCLACKVRTPIPSQ